MTKSGSLQSKFEALSKDDLLRVCLEQEDELEKLRPKPAKFRFGQVLRAENSVLRQTYAGQPYVYFTVLYVEYRNGKWHYGYAKRTNSVTGGFNTLPEDVLRAVSTAEVEGTIQPVPGQAPQPTVVHAPADAPEYVDF